LRPGGRVVIANLTPANGEIAFMESVMDWWMVYRECADLARLVDSGRLSTRTYALCGGRVACLEVSAPKAADLV